MCNMKVKIPYNQDDDLSYYPGLNHSGEIEIEFDEYIWSIHKLIDDAVVNLLIQQVFLSSIPRWRPMKPPATVRVPPVVGYKGQTYMSSGAVYAPYIPLMPMPATAGAYQRPTKQTVIQRVSNLIKKGKLYV